MYSTSYAYRHIQPVIYVHSVQVILIPTLFYPINKPTIYPKPHRRPHLLQNLPSPSLTLPSPSPPASFLLTKSQYTGTPARTNPTTTSVCTGCATTALDTKNKLTQQKQIGVVIHVLYGRLEVRFANA